MTIPTVSEAEIARFFQLALRLGLVDTTAVERWTDSIVAAEPLAHHPFSELASASRTSWIEVDELLGQVAGHRQPDIPGRLVLALLHRRVSAGLLEPEAALNLAARLGQAHALPEGVATAVDLLNESLWIAAKDTRGALQDVGREIVEFLEPYAGFDEQIPGSV
jgi:hypothetical protein